ncbi:MAG: hypothetical protein JW954_08120 [Dehalococcoidaceae bacterium]|nr:hypothetical protein [Dehalococcoidaceae bacterium]
MGLEETIKKYASDPEVVAALDPILKQRIESAIKGELDSIRKELSQGLSVIGKTLDEAVDTKIDSKLDSVRSEIKTGIAALGSNLDAIVEAKVQRPAGDAGQAQTDQDNNNGTKSRSSSMLEALAPALVQKMFSGDQEKPAGSKLGEMSAFAEAMGSAMASMASPLFNAYAAGQSATMNQMQALARWGINPFVPGGNDEETAKPAGKPGKKQPV